MLDSNHQVEPIADSETNGHSWTRSLYWCRNVHDRCQDYLRVQLKVKNNVVYGAIVVVWIAIPLFEVTMATISTNIVGNTCLPWGAYSSYALERTVPSLVMLVTYVLPLIFMVFCYGRIVHALKTKVCASYNYNSMVCKNNHKWFCYDQVLTLFSEMLLVTSKWWFVC